MKQYHEVINEMNMENNCIRKDKDITNNSCGVLFIVCHIFPPISLENITIILYIFVLGGFFTQMFKYGHFVKNLEIR